MIQPYASRTGTKRNLDALRAAGWRLMVSATGVHRTEGFRYCLDNGAWTAHKSGKPWDREAFERLLAAHGSGADFVVCPDVVSDAHATRKLFRQWMPRLLGVCPVLLAVQDGMVPWDARDAMNRGAAGLFVGGSTEWKLESLPMWGRFKARTGCYLHVGRVNSARRIAACIAAGADSFDGTSVTRFAKTLPLLDRARRQRQLWTGGKHALEAHAQTSNLGGALLAGIPRRLRQPSRPFVANSG